MLCIIQISAVDFIEKKKINSQINRNKSDSCKTKMYIEKT